MKIDSFIHKAGITVLSVLFIGVGYTFAAPSTPPSEGVGVALPITTGVAAEIKQGALTVNGGLTTTTLNASQVCIAGNCQSAWPSGANLSASVASASQTSSQYCSGFCYNTHTIDVTLGSAGILLSAEIISVTCTKSDGGQGGINNTPTVSITSNSNRTARVTVQCQTSESCGGWGGCSYNQNVNVTVEGTVLQSQ